MYYAVILDDEPGLGMAWGWYGDGGGMGMAWGWHTMMSLASSAPSPIGVASSAPSPIGVASSALLLLAPASSALLLLAPASQVGHASGLEITPWRGGSRLRLQVYAVGVMVMPAGALGGGSRLRFGLGYGSGYGLGYGSGLGLGFGLDLHFAFWVSVLQSIFG